MYIWVYDIGVKKIEHAGQKCQNYRVSIAVLFMSKLTVVESILHEFHSCVLNIALSWASVPWQRCWQSQRQISLWFSHAIRISRSCKSTYIIENRQLAIVEGKFLFFRLLHTAQTGEALKTIKTHQSVQTKQEPQSIPARSCFSASSHILINSTTIFTLPPKMFEVNRMDFLHEVTFNTYKSTIYLQNILNWQLDKNSGWWKETEAVVSHQNASVIYEASDIVLASWVSGIFEDCRCKYFLQDSINVIIPVGSQILCHLRLYLPVTLRSLFTNKRIAFAWEGRLAIICRRDPREDKFSKSHSYVTSEQSKLPTRSPERSKKTN